MMFCGKTELSTITKENPEISDMNTKESRDFVMSIIKCFSAIGTNAIYYRLLSLQVGVEK